MIIERIINNNVISSRDLDGIEIVVMGSGIGFGKKKGEPVDGKRVEKIFHMENEELLRRFKDLLAGLPLEYIQVSNEVISYAKKKLGTQLNQNVYITLTDHISFAIERFKEGMLFQNALNNEIKRFYPAEYAVGMHALRLIAQKTQITLPEDEAASIALHLVNAEFNLKVRDIWVMTDMIRRMMETIETSLGFGLKDSVDRDRFLSNLRFLAYRLLLSKPEEKTADSRLLSFIREYCPREWDCTSEVEEMLSKEYDCKLTEEEKLYLAIEIKRVRDIYGDTKNA